jgi:5-methyltetrahydropteroyltriglutamate--homocysteine methyltransferase
MRVDHVGSLLRPESLKQAFLDHAMRKLPAERLRAAQDAAIRAVVAKQEAHALPVVTDGEYRRLNWQVSFSEVMGWDLWAGSWKHSFRAPATARLKLVRSFPAEEFRFLKGVAKARTKITLMGPDRVCQMCDLEGSREIYRDREDFLSDVTAVQRQMVAELVAAGCDYVQIDEPRSRCETCGAPSLPTTL